MSKKERIEALRDKISETHAMEQSGQVWSWEACGVTGTDTCAICGLSHKWGRNGQNTGSFDEWSMSGESLSLVQAASLPCE